MNRRQYITTVGASFATIVSGAQDVRGAADRTANPTPSDDDSEEKPVYYIVNIPAIEQRLLHITIPARMLADADIIRTRSKTVESTHNIVQRTKDEKYDGWGLLTLPIQPQSVESVQLEEWRNGAVETVHETEMWNEMEMDQAALFTTASEEGYGYLGVAGGGQPVHIETANRYWTFEETDFERVKVRTPNIEDIHIKTINENERLDTIPMFELDTRTLSPTTTRR